MFFQGDFTTAVEQPIVALSAQFLRSGSGGGGSDDGEPHRITPSRAAAVTAHGGSDWEDNVATHDAQVHNELLMPLLTADGSQGNVNDVTQQQDLDSAVADRAGGDAPSRQLADEQDKQVGGTGLSWLLLACPASQAPHLQCIFCCCSSKWNMKACLQVHGTLH